MYCFNIRSTENFYVLLILKQYIIAMLLINLFILDLK